MKNTLSLTLSSTATALLAFVILAGFLFSVHIDKVYADVLPTELVELYISLDIIPAENTETARAIATESSEDKDLSELTEQLISLGIIPAENADEARSIVGSQTQAGSVREIGTSDRNPDSSFIKVYTDDGADDVAIFVFTITSDTNVEILELPVQIETGESNVENVVSDVYLSNNGIITDTYSLDCNNTVCTYTFTPAPGRMVSNAGVAEVYFYVDLKKRDGNYSNGETIQASIDEVLRDGITTRELIAEMQPLEVVALFVALDIIPDENASDARTVAELQGDINPSDLTELLIALELIPATQAESARDAIRSQDTTKTGGFSGVAIGEKHRLYTEGIFTEIVSTDETRIEGDNNVNDVGVYEIEFDVIAFEDTFYIQKNPDSVLVKYLDGTGQVTYNISPTNTLTSTAKTESVDGVSAYRIDEGDVETFTITTSIMAEMSGYYSVQGIGVFYGASPSTSLEEFHSFTPQEDFQTGYMYLSECTTCPDTSAPRIIATDVDNEVISPNGDGVKDDTTMELIFSETATATVKIVNESGVTIEENTTVNIKSLSLQWDGLDTASSSYPDGVYTFSAVLTDDNENEREEEIIDITIDNTPPTLELTGSSTITLYVGDTYNDLGATAVDNYDGEISDEITTIGDVVNTTATGTSTVLYSVTDSVGNTSTTSRTVIVLEEDTEDVTEEPTTSTSSGGGGGGGGGGGSSRDRKAPEDTSVTINDGATSTDNRLVTLRLTADDRSDPITLQVSNSNSFSDDEWSDMEESMEWVLSAGVGEKNVYVRFKDDRDNISDVVSDSIILTENVLDANSTTNVTPVGTVLGVTQFKFLHDMGIGAMNDDVIELQKRLRSEGFFTFPTNTGYYGPVTATAVQAYQRKYGISPTGYVGPLTRAQLNKQNKSSEGEISLEAFVKLLLAIGIIPEEKASVAMAALGSL